MKGTIFIRGEKITSKQEEVLECFKKENSISANTKAIQGIIMEYDLLKKRSENLLEELEKHREENFILREQLNDSKEFFSSLKRMLNNS